jgi:hypothetical protein
VCVCVCVCVCSKTGHGTRFRLKLSKPEKFLRLEKTVKNDVKLPL